MNLIGRFISCLLLCYGLYGCSPGNTTTILDEESFTLPQEFEEAGVKWTKSKELSDAELLHLSAYFKKHPSLAEGSVVRGEPTLYTNTKKVKRFYWVRHGTEQLEWLYIQFHGRKASLREGHGSPLSN
ncbi:hypothetical protein [Thalassoglobus sp.]|uniref:hypothetical protein n=1 Tax=Thalassoglobus sp. TaxID=2795869 RepID=UPI003AA91CCF